MNGVRYNYFLTSVLDGCEWQIPITPVEETAPFTQPKAGLDSLGRRKNSFLCSVSIRDASVAHPVAWFVMGLRYSSS